MIYKCRNCDHEEGFGVLPGVSCGLMIAGQMGLAVGFLITIIPRLFPDGLGWWWLLAAPLVIVLSLPGALLLNLILELLERVAITFFKCPRCGSRAWSWGFTSGFGL